MLDGLSGDARRARTTVLQRLADGGATTADLVRATREGRLAHMLLENALAPHGGTHTLVEISLLTGVSVGDVERWFRALGRGVSTSTFADYSDEDLGLARLLVGYRDLGLDEDGLLASARILGRNIWAVADSVESLLQERLAAAREHPEVALRYADEFRRLAEMQAQILAHVVSTHLRQQMRAGVADERAAGAREVAVCFVDLVGFTVLGEQVSPADLGRLAERLDTLATDLVEQPVRFVKMVGDAVMLISPDAAEIGRAVIRIFSAARAEGLPPLHAGIAWGPAMPGAGDWIGRPVNLASRIVAVALPDTILVDNEVRTRLTPAELSSDSVGLFTLKGFGGQRELFRLRAAESGTDTSAVPNAHPT